MFDLPETITVWNQSSNDGFGGIVWTTPLTYSARHAEKQEQFRDESGNLTMSKSVVYSEGSTIDIGSMIFIGTSADPSPPATADEVRARASTPSGTNLKKFWL